MADHPPRRKLGRPPLDPSNGSVRLSITMPTKTFDAVYAGASAARLTMAEYVRRRLRAGATARRERAEPPDPAPR